MREAQGFRIGELAKRSGVPSKTIRYYESVGILSPPKRQSNGYRSYGQQDLVTLTFVRSARALGFSLDEVRALLNLWEDKARSSREVKKLAEARIQEIDSKVQDLLGLREELRRLCESCHGDERPDCPILDSLEGERPAGRKNKQERKR